MDIWPNVNDKGLDCLRACLKHIKERKIGYLFQSSGVSIVIIDLSEKLLEITSPA